MEMACGWELRYPGANRNPVEVYQAFQRIDKHIKGCLPCLVEHGSMQRLMMKDIQKWMASLTIRALAIVCPWIAIVSTFIVTHRNIPITSNDFPYAVLSVVTLVFNCFVTLMDGPREFE